jgi:hypothetical protein
VLFSTGDICGHTYENWMSKDRHQAGGDDVHLILPRNRIRKKAAEARYRGDADDNCGGRTSTEGFSRDAVENVRDLSEAQRRIR